MIIGCFFGLALIGFLLQNSWSDIEHVFEQAAKLALAHRLGSGNDGGADHGRTAKESAAVLSAS
jgi:hypothetical protein